MKKKIKEKSRLTSRQEEIIVITKLWDWFAIVNNEDYYGLCREYGEESGERIRQQLCEYLYQFKKVLRGESKVVAVVKETK